MGQRKYTPTCVKFQGDMMREERVRVCISPAPQLQLPKLETTWNLQGVWCLSHSGLKMGIESNHFGLKA